MQVERVLYNTCYMQIFIPHCIILQQFQSIAQRSYIILWYQSFFFFLIFLYIYYHRLNIILNYLHQILYLNIFIAHNFKLH